jgi:hypothetical protein
MLATAAQLKLAQRRSRILHPGGGVLVFGATALRAGWGTYAATVVRARGNTDGLVIGIAERATSAFNHSDGPRGARQPLGSASRLGCAELLENIDMDSLQLNPGPLLRACLGREALFGHDDESVIDTVLTDFTACSGDGAFPNLAAATAVPSSFGGPSATQCVNETMNALRACSGLLKRDATLLCRLPQGIDLSPLTQGLRDVFSEVQVPVKDEATRTLLLLARKSRTVKSASGRVQDASQWHRYHRKLAPLAVRKKVPLIRSDRTAGPHTPYRRHFVAKQFSRNLEIVPPTKVARQQLDSVRAAAQRTAADDKFESLGQDVKSKRWNPVGTSPSEL